MDDATINNMTAAERDKKIIETEVEIYRINKELVRWKKGREYLLAAQKNLLYAQIELPEFSEDIGSILHGK